MLSLAFSFGACDKENSADGVAQTAAAQNPMSEVDVMINEYEKAAKDYVKVAKKFKGGDVSLTVRYIGLGRTAQEKEAKLRTVSSKMTAPQSQRVAAISATTAP